MFWLIMEKLFYIKMLMIYDLFGNETIYKNYNLKKKESSFGNRSFDNLMIRSSNSSNLLK